MKRTYVNRLPKNEEVKNTNVRIENGELIVEVEFEDRLKPKDGDFLVTNIGCIFIYNTKYNLRFLKGFYVGINADDEIVISDKTSGYSGVERFATEKEKSDFLERLEKECGKRWNAEKKCLEDIRWKPNDGDYYFFIDSDGKIKRTRNVSHWDFIRVSINNCFPTEEAAQPYVEKIKDIFKKLKS